MDQSFWQYLSDITSTLQLIQHLFWELTKLTTYVFTVMMSKIRKGKKVPYSKDRSIFVPCFNSQFSTTTSFASIRLEKQTLRFIWKFSEEPTILLQAMPLKISLNKKGQVWKFRTEIQESYKPNFVYWNKPVTLMCA